MLTFVCQECLHKAGISVVEDDSSIQSVFLDRGRIELGIADAICCNWTSTQHGSHRIQILAATDSGEYCFG